MTVAVRLIGIIINKVKALQYGVLFNCFDTNLKKSFLDYLGCKGRDLGCSCNKCISSIVVTRPTVPPPPLPQIWQWDVTLENILFDSGEEIALN